MICLKNVILKTITVIAVLVLFTSFLFFDVVELEDLWIPAIPYFLSLIWLFLFGVANTPKRGKKEWDMKN